MRGHRGTDLTSGGTWIPNILNTAVADDSWTAITLGATDMCRSLIAGLRSGATWKVSHLAAGTRYKTVQGNLEMDIVKGKAATVFYVQTASGNDTLECVILD